MTTLTIRKLPIAEAMEQARAKIRDLPTRPEGRFLPASDGTQASEIRPQIPEDDDEDDDSPLDEIKLPLGWSKGALLNVRNRGDHYCVTLYPEEYDPRYPERALTFPNSWTCQDFVSTWYSRESADPRAR